MMNFENRESSPAEFGVEGLVVLAGLQALKNPNDEPWHPKPKPRPKPGK